MPKNWILLDTESHTRLDEFETAANGCRITKKTLRGGLREGVDVIHVDNGKFEFDVVPTRGMALWKAWLGDFELGWKSPVRGPVHPSFVPTVEPSGLGWLDGFDELLVRCGLESNGAPEFDDNGQLLYQLHGRIGNRPAHRVEVSIDDDGEVSVSGQVEETRFHFLKARLKSTVTTRPGQSGLKIHDTVENLSASPAEIQMLYHMNFGLPFLDGGSQVVAPVKTVVPRNERAARGIGTWNSYSAEEAGFEEQVYFADLFANDDGLTQVLLRNAHGLRGASLSFNTNQLPCFTVWKNTTAAADGCVTGLEPGTNFPNPRTFEGKHDRVAKLEPLGSCRFDLELTAHADAESVERAAKEITALQSADPVLHEKPQPDWCA